MSYHASSSALPEQDAHGGDDLPTYDELAAQHGPNSRYLYRIGFDGVQVLIALYSRFGRWREWIEKRCVWLDDSTIRMSLTGAIDHLAT